MVMAAVIINNYILTRYNVSGKNFLLYIFLLIMISVLEQKKRGFLFYLFHSKTLLLDYDFFDQENQASLKANIKHKILFKKINMDEMRQLSISM